jgi:hypothetical protein
MRLASSQDSVVRVFGGTKEGIVRFLRVEGSGGMMLKK